MVAGAKSEGDEERSLRDDLAAGLKEIEEREASAAPDDEGAPAPEPQAKPQAADTEADRGDGRNVHGRFVKKGEGAADQQTRSADNQPPVAADSQPQPVGERSPSDPPASQQGNDEPPKSWRADEAKVWSQLPPEAKAAISRREAEAARLAGANDGERMFGREIAEIVRPYAGELQQAGVTPQAALRVLFDNHKILRTGTQEQKLGKARQLMIEYGIDPQALAIPDPNAPSDPHVYSLQQQIARLEQRLANPQPQNFAPLPPSQEEGTIMAELEAFRADPAHPHFDAVGPTMGKLLETGAAPDLESAYQAAVAMDPALRSTAVIPTPAAIQAEKTAAARRASASVSGSPGPAGNPMPMTLRDDLAEGMRNLGWNV